MNIIGKAMAHFGFAPPFHDIDVIHESSPGGPSVDELATPGDLWLLPDQPDWDAMRDDIAFVRGLILDELAQIDDRKHALLTAVDALDAIDPTSAGLADTVTDINTKRK